jgi:hypothetical protein
MRSSTTLTSLLRRSPGTTGRVGKRKDLGDMPRELERSRGRLDFIEHQEGASLAKAKKLRESKVDTCFLARAYETVASFGL